MATMTPVARVLRLDRGTWLWLDSDASVRGAGFMVIGTYLILAFGRFGWPDFAVRATTRMLLVGFYGWMGLAVAAWLAVRLAGSKPAPFSDFARLTGHAHLPLLLVAVTLLVFPVTFDVGGVGRWPAIFVALFWMPAMLVNAVATGSGWSRWQAAGPAIVAYVVWAAVVGRWLWRMLGHLM